MDRRYPFKIFFFLPFPFELHWITSLTVGTGDRLLSPQSVPLLLGCLICFIFMTKNAAILILQETSIGRVENICILSWRSGLPYRLGGPGFFLFRE